MLNYIIKRILLMLVTVLGVIILVFVIEYSTPGDPVAAILGPNYTQEQYEAKAAQLGLDKPFVVQLWNYVKGIVTKFDFGISYGTKRPVREQIFARFRPTLIIGVMGVMVSSLIAIPLGILAATKHQSPLDYGVQTFTIIFAAIPGFWLAMMMMLMFCLKLKWFPAAGITSWKGFVLPIFCASLQPLVTTCRMTRSSMLEVIRQDYIRTARAKGLSERVITRKHALGNALIPVLTILGMHLGGALGGSILVETIFTVPGLGVLMKDAIKNQDYPLIQGGVLFLSFIFCAMNLLTDLAYGVADPRVREQLSSVKKKNRTGKKAVASA
jgi:peptide/nickel transport system permease protein